MAIYCISDIHGRYKEFMTLLDKVSPRESDSIYVLGDIIDRGDESARMLKWAIDECNDNVKFLLGNHEDMSAASIGRNPETLPSRMYDLWLYNGGLETKEQLLKETSAEWRANRLLPWIMNLPLYAVVEADGIKWMLVHAGFKHSCFHEDKCFNLFSDGNLDEFSKQDIIDLSEYGFGQQWAQDLLWERYQWLAYKKLTPMPVVFGHTPIEKEYVEYCQFKNIPCAGGDGRIFYVYNRIDIDCGRRNLGMIRLDDMEEFYLNE